MNFENLLKASFSFVEKMRLNLIKEELTFYKLKVKTKKDRDNILQKRKICHEEICKEVESLKLVYHLFNYSIDSSIIVSHKSYCKDKMKLFTDFYETLILTFEEVKEEICDLEKFDMCVSENKEILKNTEIICFEHMLLSKTYEYIYNIYENI